jgi:hypothetical protein
MPYNIYKQFVLACRDDPRSVNVEPQAEKDAREIYGLKTKKDLKEFIGNNGLDSVQFFSKAPWRNNPDKSIQLEVYAYICKTLFFPCYLAIIFIPSLFGNTVNRWNIKSFHTPQDTQNQLGEQLKKLGF